MDDKITWEAIGHDVPLTDEAIRHLENGTIAVRAVPLGEIERVFATATTEEA